jgi:TrmH family RNA methyltransferase
VPALGPRHHEVRRIRALVRDARARRDEGRCVIEGPRVITAALDRGAELESAYLAPGAEPAFITLVTRLRASDVPVAYLKEGVVERIGDTVTPQPVLAVAKVPRYDVSSFGPDGPVLVAVTVRDPGNAGTMLRSAEGAGAAGVLFCGNSVDMSSPKVVRSSAGAIFGVRAVEADDPVQALETLGRQGRRRLGTMSAGGDTVDGVDLTGPVALVVGNESWGLPAELDSQLDGTLTVPLEGPVESLNVAMAATVLLF